MRYFARAVWQGVTNFLAIVGVVAVVFGLLYRFAAGQVPHLLQAHGTLLRKSGALLRGHGTTGADSHRAAVLLATGALCLLVAWLIRPRRKS
jgi:4-amino-4-deoxy-L-arabinose transferase-like glycosyltransferase